MTAVFNGGGSFAVGDTTSTWAAKVEYLVGVALSVDPNGDADTPIEVLWRVNQLVSGIFDAEQIRMITESIENADTDADAGERALLLQQMQLEYQADRMPVTEYISNMSTQRSRQAPRLLRDRARLQPRRCVSLHATPHPINDPELLGGDGRYGLRAEQRRTES